MRKILVACIGNRLMKDDGAGSIFADILLKEKLPSNVEVIDYGISAISLLHDLADYDYVIFIDSMKKGEEAGSIYHIRISSDDIEDTSEDEANQFFTLSFHEIDLERLLPLSKKLNQLPKNIEIYGIEPKDISPGIGLSKEVQKALELLKKIILERVTNLVDA
ncbi:MAG: hydrogenase maturation protease [Candidatus Asgardarchaeia archaeon]